LRFPFSVISPLFCFGFFLIFFHTFQILAEPVTVSYASLSDKPDTLVNDISKAFGSGPDCLGIIVVTDLPPEYPVLRERLLQLAFKFAQLDEATREKYSDPTSRYRHDCFFSTLLIIHIEPGLPSFGWSYGKEIMNGSPGLLEIHASSSG
jgi:hypothetical protein